jgi:hypothetical protein
MHLSYSAYQVHVFMFLFTLLLNPDAFIIACGQCKLQFLYYNNGIGAYITFRAMVHIIIKNILYLVTKCILLWQVSSCDFMNHFKIIFL